MLAIFKKLIFVEGVLLIFPALVINGFMVTDNNQKCIVFGIMNSVLADHRLLERHAEELRGVFTVSDLRNLFEPASEVELFRRIRRLQANRVLRRFCKSVYVVEKFNLEAVSCRINPESYISFGSVLSQHLLIGVIPTHTVTAVKVGRGRQYGNGMGTIVHLGIVPHLMFGIEFKEGIRRADAEKAYLDTLYFYQKGRHFSFDVFSDINNSGLDRDRIGEYLKHYRNPKFVRFVENCLDADK